MATWPALRVVAGELPVQRVRRGRPARRDRAIGVGALPGLARFGLRVPHDQDVLRLGGAFLQAVDEQGEDVLVGGMRKDLARFDDRHPDDVVDFADIGPVHGAERVDEMLGVGGGYRLRHPVENVLGVERPVRGTAGFAALLAQRVLDLAEVRAELHAEPGLLADLAHGRMTVGFVELELAFRPAPIVVFRPVDDADLDAIEDVRLVDRGAVMLGFARMLAGRGIVVLGAVSRGAVGCRGFLRTARLADALGCAGIGVGGDIGIIRGYVGG